jgi:hypothetical protein
LIRLPKPFTGICRGGRVAPPSGVKAVTARPGRSTLAAPETAAPFTSASERRDGLDPSGGGVALIKASGSAGPSQVAVSFAAPATLFQAKRTTRVAPPSAGRFMLVCNHSKVVGIWAVDVTLPLGVVALPTCWVTDQSHVRWISAAAKPVGVSRTTQSFGLICL